MRMELPMSLCFLTLKPFVGSYPQLDLKPIRSVLIQETRRVKSPMMTGTRIMRAEPSWRCLSM